MKKTKTTRRFALALALMLVLLAALTGCGGGATEEPAGNEAPDALKIGIVQIVEHPSLDTIRESIISQLADEGFEDGKNITIEPERSGRLRGSYLTGVARYGVKVINPDYGVSLTVTQ